jgi:hypothetical protein
MMAEDQRDPGMYVYRSNQHILLGDNGIPEPEQIDIRDIAYGLSGAMRFAGHTSRPISVAEHSLYVLQMAKDMGADPLVCFQALMHDATEAYISDIPSWVKVQIPALKELERRVWVSICKRFNLPIQMDSVVKDADMVSLFAEAICLTKADVSKWNHFDEYGESAKQWLEQYGPIASAQPHRGLIENTFLDAFRVLHEGPWIPA